MSVFRYLKPYKVAAGVALFFMLVELLVELAQPLLMAHIINNGIVQKNLTAVWHWGAAMLGVTLLAFFSGILNSFYASHTSQSFGLDLRVKVFKKIQAFSFSNFNQFPTASLITRMTNDLTQVQNTVFMGLRIMLRAPLLVIGGTLSVLLVNAQLGLFFVVVIPFLIGFLIWAMNFGGRLFRLVQERLDSVNGTMRENLIAMRLIKAIRRGPFETTRFDHASTDLKERTVKALRLMETTMPTLLLVMNLCLIGIIWVGHIQYQSGSIQIGDLVAIVNYATRITGAFTPLSFIIMAFSRARASASRLERVLNEEVDLTDDKADLEFTQIKGGIEFQNVSFSYPGTDSLVLTEISFKVEPGQTVAFLGATGSGKSSLFQLIPRLYEVTGGSVSLEGKDLRTFTFGNLRQQIGYVPQEALLFTGSVRENISWGNREATMEDIIKAAQHAQIHETILSLPDQYDTVLGQRGVNLSGGQKQRLSIARALIRNPKLLLLDDSTSALDLKTEAKLLQAIEQNYSCTTLIITQKISTAKKADWIGLLDDGRLMGLGTHETLLANLPLYQSICESQKGREGEPVV